jgi:hypothetical protein
VPAGTPGPDRRRVEAEEPSADQVTDAQLQSALDRQTADERRLEPTQERAAVAAAWKQVHPHISAARTWSHVKQRAAVGLLVNEGEAAQPVVVNVVTVWSGDDPQGVTEVHRAETRLTYRSSDNTWQPLS